MAMRDVHTDVGRSRAWIRLALEQKKLHDYLDHLLSDGAMLKYVCSCARALPNVVSLHESLVVK